MPNSLTRVLPFALVSSTCLPVSVCGTGTGLLRLVAFLGSSVASLPLSRVPFTPLPPLMVFPPGSQGYTLGLALPSASSTPHSASPLQLWLSGTGMFTCCPSPTPFGLGLGPTNPTRTDLPSESLDFRRIRFSRISRYSCQHSHFCSLHLASQLGFFARTTLPYQCKPYGSHPVASVVSFSLVTFSAQHPSTSELLRTLLRMAASKPTSWLSRRYYIVSHLAYTSRP